MDLLNPLSVTKMVDKKKIKHTSFTLRYNK